MARMNALITLLTVLGLVAADGMYSAKSPVLQINAKNYDALIAQSNHTSVGHTAGNNITNIVLTMT